MASVELLISGYVQGVGFRHFVYKTALAMHVNGEVWNGLDQAVHAIAQHEDEAVLTRFKEELWRGPGRVDEVRSEATEARKYEAFEVSLSR